MNDKFKYLIYALLISFPLYASNLISFSPNDPIRSSDINNNFNYVKGILQGRNISVNFKNFQMGDIIMSSEFETEFDKLRNLNIAIEPLSLLQIKSSELNQAFSQMAAGAMIVDDIPVSFDFSFSMSEDSQYLGTASFNNQTGSTVLEIVSSPTKGAIILGLNGNFTYSPFLNQNGSDSFTFRVSDGNNNSNISTASITIDQINDAPVANNQSLLTEEDTNLNITLSGSDVENSLLTYEIISSPSNGILSGSGDNIIYSPNSNFNGMDSFTFRINDGSLNSNIATISINVNPVNDAPTTVNQNLATNEDTLLNITLSGNDPELASLTYEIISPPVNGILSGTGSNRTYLPNSNFNGSDSFTFRVSDGVNNSNTSTVSIVVNPINDAPVASSQNLAVTDEESLNVLFTASDVEGDTLSYEIVSNPGQGSLSGSGNSRVYKPNINFNGTDSFTFRAFDGQSYSLSTTVSIAVTAVWPTGADGPLNITIGNQTIPAGSVKNYSSINISAGATLTIQGSNAITIIGSSGPIVVNGSIIVDNTGDGSSTSLSATTPNGLALASQQIRTAGGAGGRGGGGHPTNPSPVNGGVSIGGRGGGGAGGRGTGNTGASGSAPPVPSGTADTTLLNGGNGGNGNSGGGAGSIGAGGGQAGTRHSSGASAAGGGGGGGGGYFGDHGLPLYVKSKISISGTGLINLSGKNGYNGGNGGNGGYLNGSEISERNCRATGGGGGGGSGGEGGDLWLHSPSVSINSNVSGGLGGSGGLTGGNSTYENWVVQGVYSYCGRDGGAGSSGANGQVNTIIIP